MKKGTLTNYKTDPYYQGIVRAVGNILSEARFVAPVDVFIRLGLLAEADFEDWRFGRIPYLEGVIHCNLSKASRILRILRFHAHDLNLKPSHTAYVKWGRGKSAVAFFQDRRSEFRRSLFAAFRRVGETEGGTAEEMRKLIGLESNRASLGPWTLEVFNLHNH